MNNYLLGTPHYLPGPLKINTNGRNGRPAFNTVLFPEETLGQLGNARRRVFYGPGINNFDLALQKNVRLGEARFLEFRAEAFNAFNHTQFYGRHRWTGKLKTPTSAISSALSHHARYSWSQNSISNAMNNSTRFVTKEALHKALSESESPQEEIGSLCRHHRSS